MEKRGQQRFINSCANSHTVGSSKMKNLWAINKGLKTLKPAVWVNSLVLNNEIRLGHRISASLQNICIKTLIKWSWMNDSLN